MALWRVLRTGYSSAAMNMAIDQAVMEARREGRVHNTLRVYQWEPSAVSIGYFQGIEEEVDLNACKKHGVDVVRRLTGAGAVFHDKKGEVTYSIIFGEGDVELPGPVKDSYPILCSGIVDGLERLGIEAGFRPINDIVVGEKKISGSAQTRRWGCILQHGTLLYDVDPRLMFTLLRVPNEKIRDKMIAAVEERVTSVRHETGGIVSIQEVEEALIEGFANVLDMDVSSEDLSPGEMERAEELARNVYASREWNFRR